MSMLTHWQRTRQNLADRWGIDLEKLQKHTEKHVYHESDDSQIMTVRDYEPPPLKRPKREMMYGNPFDDCFL